MEYIKELFVYVSRQHNEKRTNLNEIVPNKHAVK
jgi:hypothetical protein